MDNNETINLSYLHQIGNNNTDFLFDMINMLIKQLPEYQELMSTYFEDKDWKKLGALAHKCKSSVLMLGMNNLAIELKNFELDAKDGKNIESFPKIISKFVKESNLAIKELNKYKKNNNK